MTDSFLDEVTPPPPDRIDIYVDGCALVVGKFNSAAPAGWGAVVVETTNGEVTSRWRASDSLESVSSADAEVAAALGGMHAVHQRISSLRHCDTMPKIVLHTDQADLPVAVRGALTPLSGDGESSSAMRQLACLIDQTGAEIEYTKATKTTRDTPTTDSQLMDVAHDMASIAAWGKRLELQGGVLGQASTGPLNEEDSARKIAGMQDASEARWQQLINSPECDDDFMRRKGSEARDPGGKAEETLPEKTRENISMARRIARGRTPGSGSPQF